jgi:transposase
MSLHAQSIYTVPEKTAEIARAIFPDGNLYMKLFDTFGSLFSDQDFALLFPDNGQPAFSPVRLMLVLILQFVEGLSDRQAADAVRARIDWKYLLCLELTDPGFDYSILSEFRTRLLENEWEQKLFDKLLVRFREAGYIKKHGQQRTDSTMVLGAVRELNRLEMVGETMRHALDSLAVVAPEWILGHIQPAWVDRYGSQIQNYRLPTSQEKRDAFADQIGADGLVLLKAILDAASPDWLREVPAIRTLHTVWIQNFTWRDEDQLRWRQKDELPPASVAINSPFDDEVRFSIKRHTSWIGYKVHLTETCDDQLPRIITEVKTTLAPIADGQMTTPIHEALQAKDLLPVDHLVDTGYLDAELLVASQETYGVSLVGPTRVDTGWQARQTEAGFAAEAFKVDWERQQATCPAGKTNQYWQPGLDTRGNASIHIRFNKADCGICPLHIQCTRSQPPRRTITVRPQPQQLALQAAREREKTEAFKKQYAHRAGIEGTISLGVRSFDLRRTRYIGLAKTHLQHILIACGMNLMRLARWLNGEIPAQPRPSAFTRLYQASLA